MSGYRVFRLSACFTPIAVSYTREIYTLILVFGSISRTSGIKKPGYQFNSAFVLLLKNLPPCPSDISPSCVIRHLAALCAVATGAEGSHEENLRVFWVYAQ